MTTTPAGSPAWTRTVDHSHYGGNVNKRNYMLFGPINAQTDISAEEYCRMASDLACVVRTAPMWVFTFLNNDTVAAAPTIQVIYGMTGVRLVSYEGDAAAFVVDGILNGSTNQALAAEFADGFNAQA